MYKFKLKKSLLALISVLFLANLNGQTLMPLPPHSSVYSGIYARGMWFVAPTDFVISGLRVPIDAGAGDQYIHVVRFSGTPVTSTAGSNNFTTLTYISAAPNNVIQAVNIPITSGDVIGILGTSGNIQNSYGSGFATNINGFPTTLNRLGYQGSINGGPAPNMWGATSGSIGRIEMYWKLPSTAPNDAGVVSIDGPSNCSGENEVRATIKNFGVNQVNPVTVKWEVNGLPQPDVIYNNVLDTFNGTSPQAAQVVLGNVILISGLSVDITAWTEMPNNQIDTVTENDTAYKTIDALPTISAFPFSENFEGGQGDWFIDGTNSSWAFGTPAKTTISGASSGVNAFVTGGLGTGFHNDDEKSYVNSPCFDLSGFEGTPWVALDVWWNIELGWDGAALQVSNDGGDNWQTVGKTDDPYNWYTDSTLEGKPGDQDHGWSGRTSEANTGSGGWVNAKHGLDESFVDQVVRFRVAMGSDAATVDDGIAFDDFRIVDYKNANLGPDKRSLCQTSSMSLDPEVNFNGKIWWSTLDSTNQTIVVTTTGSYWVTYTDTLIDLTSTDTVEIIQSPPLVIDWAPYEDTIYKDNISTLNPRLPLDVDYTWTPGGYTFPFYVVRGSEFAPGTHQFKLNVVDSVLCSDEKSVTVVILDALGVGTYGSGLVKMYPNPTRDFINIELIGIEGAMQLQMTDVNGRIVRDEVIRASTGQKIQVDISNLVLGSYIVRLVNDNGVLIHKIIKE